MKTLTREDIIKIQETDANYVKGLNFLEAVTDAYKYTSEHSTRLPNGKWEFMNHSVPYVDKTTMDIYIKRVNGIEYIYIIGADVDRYVLTLEYKQILGL